MAITSITAIFDLECWPVGGGHTNVFLYESRLATYQRNNQGVVTNVSVDGPVWQLPIYMDSIELKEREVISNGQYIDTTLSFNTLNRPEVRNWRKDNWGKAFNAIVIKPDGSIRIVGTKDTPMLSIAEANDGKVFADPQLMPMTFAGQQMEYAWMYEQTGGSSFPDPEPPDEPPSPE